MKKLDALIQLLQQNADNGDDNGFSRYLLDLALSGKNYILYSGREFDDENEYQLAHDMWRRENARVETANAANLRVHPPMVAPKEPVRTPDLQARMDHDFSERMDEFLHPGMKQQQRTMARAGKDLAQDMAKLEADTVENVRRTVSGMQDLNAVTGNVTNNGVARAVSK